VALHNLTIEGVATTIPFHLAMMDDPAFQAGEVHTGYVENDLMKRWKAIQEKEAVPSRANAGKDSQEHASGNGTALPHKSEARSFEIEVNQRLFKVSVSELIDPSTEGQSHSQQRRPAAPAPIRHGARTRRGAAPHMMTSNSGELRAAMNGVVKEILVSVGAKVEAGQRLVIFEAMKMESDLVSPRAGTVSGIMVKAGQTVAGSALLLTVGD
jgi:acetyl-CoA/propionyl-CoA carboxylase biotin carboxyl carrier protein